MRLIDKLHCAAYAVFPAFVPVPASKLPAPPTELQRIETEIAHIRELVLTQYLKLAEVEADAKGLEFHLARLEALHDEYSGKGI